MQSQLFIERIIVSAVAVFAGIVYLLAALRVKRNGNGSSSARLAISAFAFLVAGLVALRDLDPVVGYSLTALSLVAVSIADLVRDERARGRRIAALAPRPVAEFVPTLWIGVALVSLLALVPYMHVANERIPATIAGVCVIAMAAIAWRIASAPTQLTSANPARERICEQASRVRSSGMACVLACGIVFVFVNFVNGTLPAVEGGERFWALAMFVLWAGLWAWASVYVKRLSHAKPVVSP